MTKELDFFGELLMKKFRDIALEMIEGLCENRFDSPGHRVFQNDLAKLSDEHRKIVQDTVGYCVDGALNDFLHHFDKELRRKKARMQLTVDQVNLIEQCAGLREQLDGLTGWKRRFSKYAETAK